MPFDTAPTAPVAAVPARHSRRRPAPEFPGCETVPLPTRNCFPISDNMGSMDP